MSSTISSKQPSNNKLNQDQSQETTKTASDLIEYDILLQRMLTLSSQFSSKQNIVFGSVYIDFDPQSQARSMREALELKTKNAIKNSLSEIEALHEHKQARLSLESALAEFATSIDTQYFGYALFYILNLEPNVISQQSKQDGNNPCIEFMEFVPMIVPIQQSFCISHDFNILQLIYNYQQDMSVLSLVLSEERMQAYTYRQLKLEDFGSVYNDYIKFSSDERYNNEGAPSVFGPRNNFEDLNSDRDFIQRFLRDNIQDFIKKIQDKFDIVLIYYSDKFEKTLQDYLSTVHETFETVLTIPKNLDSQDKLRIDIRERVSSMVTSDLINELEHSQEDDAVVKDLSEITMALRQGKIDTLFLKSSFTHEGYVSADGYVYVDQIQNAEYQNNIVPWLVKQTIALGGEVLVVEDNEPEETKLESGALAHLRF